MCVRVRVVCCAVTGASQFKRGLNCACVRVNVATGATQFKRMCCSIKFCDNYSDQV